MAAVKPIPEGYTSVTAYLIVSKAEDALAFYEKAFNAKLHMRLDGPDGAIAHCEFHIGNAVIMMGSENPEMGWTSPTHLGGTATSFMIYTEHCDALFAQAIAAGATQIEAVEDKFYGDRAGKVRCPFGHEWSIATHTEDLPQEEILARMMKLYG
jgi:PhnB protein